jgi:hypothetical protein
MTKTVYFCEGEFLVSLTFIFLYNLFYYSIFLHLKNSTLILTSKSPDFSNCFQNIILLWIPCLYMILIGPLKIYLIKYDKIDRIVYSSPVSYAKAVRLYIYLYILFNIFKNYFYF